MSWYILRTFVGNEIRLAKKLEEDNITQYVPKQLVIEPNKPIKEIPLFASYVFTEQPHPLPQLRNIIRLHYLSIDKVPCVIPDHIIDDVRIIEQQMLVRPAAPRQIQKNDIVLFTDGYFIGQKGRVTRSTTGHIRITLFKSGYAVEATESELAVIA